MAEVMEANGQSGMTISEEVAIQIIGMHKWYGEFHVLKDLNLTVQRGERIVICGPSGSGKSTMIRCINRLEEHQRGQIIGIGRLEQPVRRPPDPQPCEVRQIAVRRQFSAYRGERRGHTALLQPVADRGK